MTTPRNRVNWSPWLCLALPLSIFASMAQANTVTLTELPAPEPTFYQAANIADDGTVVGNAGLGGSVIRWLPGASAPEDLGGETATVDNVTPLISKDGSTIVAAYLYDDGTKAATWSGGTDWTVLPGLMLSTSGPYGISNDGSHIVGAGGGDGGLLLPWIWDAANGQQILALPDNVAGGQAWAVSNDGRIVAGEIAPDPADPFADVAARWVDGVPEYLTDQDGNALGQSVACNADCSVIVGYAGTASNQAWRWTEATGVQYLGTLPDAAPDSTYVAIDLNRDGTVIVGSYYAFDPTLGNVNRPFIWTPADHLQDLLSYLADNGIDYGAGFNDLVANAVTSNGRQIVLNGMDADYVHKAAVITITPPDPIFADGFDTTPL